jgi:hypothetical protein
MISGVQFRRSGRDFVSVDDPMPPEAVSALLAHHTVELEVSTAPTGSIVVVENESEETDDGASDQGDDTEDTDTESPAKPDPMASLWRNEPKQEPVMRKRGRPPLSR